MQHVLQERILMTGSHWAQKDHSIYKIFISEVSNLKCTANFFIDAIVFHSPMRCMCYKLYNYKRWCIPKYLCLHIYMYLKSTGWVPFNGIVHRRWILKESSVLHTRIQFNHSEQKHDKMFVRATYVALHPPECQELVRIDYKQPCLRVLQSFSFACSHLCQGA